MFSALARLRHGIRGQLLIAPALLLVLMAALGFAGSHELANAAKLAGESRQETNTVEVLGDSNSRMFEAEGLQYLALRAPSAPQFADRRGEAADVGREAIEGFARPGRRARRARRRRDRPPAPGHRRASLGEHRGRGRAGRRGQRRDGGRRAGSVVTIVADAASRTEEGTGTVEQTRAAFERIDSPIEQMDARITAVGDAAHGVAEGASGLRTELDDVAGVAARSTAASQQVSAATQQSSASAQEIAASAERLKGLRARARATRGPLQARGLTTTVGRSSSTRTSSTSSTR